MVTSLARSSLLVVVGALAATGCSQSKSGEVPGSHPVAAVSTGGDAHPSLAGQPPGVAMGRWAGTLPCADCAGILTELVLLLDREGPEAVPLRYELVETYLATPDGDQAFSSFGPWTRLRGSTADSQARVVQLLDSGVPDQVRNFLLTPEGDLRLLDGNRAEIESQLPYILQQVR